MEAKGNVKTTVKKTVTVNGKNYELTCIAYGSMTAPVSFYQRERRRAWGDSEPEDYDVDYSSAEYEWDSEEWEYDGEFETNFKDCDELYKFLDGVKEDLMSQVYENFEDAEVTDEYLDY